MISIIVPIFNVKNYLGNCVDSILSSSYQDFELILVDDGSTDGSSDLCDLYSNQDDRIRVIHKVNGGVSDARNMGLKAAIGDSVMFVDGDDMIHPQMLEMLKSALDSGDYDFSMAKEKRIAEDDIDGIRSFMESSKEKAKGIEISQFDFMNQLVSSGEDRFWCLSVCNKLYARTIVEDLFFDTSIKNTEDLEWSTRLSLKINRAVALNEQTYLYIHRRGSAMHGGMNPEYVKGIYVYKKVVDYMPAQLKAKALKQLYTYMLLIRRYSIHSEHYQEAKTICDEMYKNTIKEFCHSDINWVSKLRSILGYHFPGPYNFITRILEVIMVSFYRLKGRKW